MMTTASVYQDFGPALKTTSLMKQVVLVYHVMHLAMKVVYDLVPITVAVMI
jgi:hypothetical protein